MRERSSLGMTAKFVATVTDGGNNLEDKYQRRKEFQKIDNQCDPRSPKLGS